MAVGPESGLHFFNSTRFVADTPGRVYVSFVFVILLTLRGRAVDVAGEFGMGDGSGAGVLYCIGFSLRLWVILYMYGQTWFEL